MSTELPTMVLLRNGTFLSRGRLLSSGSAPNKRDWIYRSFAHTTASSQTGPFIFQPSFTVEASLLEPEQEYEVWLTEYKVPKWGDDPSSSYPNAWEEYFDDGLGNNTNSGWRMPAGTTDIDGKLSSITITGDNVSFLPMYHRQEAFGKPEGDPIENYEVQLGSVVGADPNLLVQTELDSISETPFEVTYDDEVFTVLALPRRVEYELKIYNTTTLSFERTIRMEVDYILATDLNVVSGTVPDALADGVINMPVDFDGDATQYWAPWFTPATGEGTGIFTDDIKENFATAPTNDSHWTPIEIIHPTDPTLNLRLINNLEDLTFTIEVGAKLFTAANYDIGRLGSSAEGIQELNLAVGNVDKVAGDWLFEAATHNEPIEVIVHYYLQSDLTTPQLVPPVSLFLTDVEINVFQITGRLSFINLKDTPFPSESYTRKRFPSLGG